ncbi:MAG TPA: TolC family protein [Chitinophagaceae bacterium]|nr:TolC family protein [Chitinophagaceae bacterium]
MNRNRVLCRTGRTLSLAFFLSMLQLDIAAQSAADSLLQDATLDKVVSYAIKRQPRVQQALIDESITAEQVKSKLGDWYPQVSFNYLYQHNFQVQTNIIGGNPVQLGVNNTSALQFLLTQNIFNRDVLLANRTKNEVQQLARQQTAGTKIDLVSSVTKAFYDVLATQMQTGVVNENIVRLERSLKDAKAQYDAGVVDKTDYKRATIALNNARATLKSTEELLTAKTIYLKALINYPAAEDLQIVYDTATLEREILLDTAATAAYSNRVEFQILETQRHLQQANVKYNKWSYIPSVSASAAYIRNFLNDSFSKLYSQSFPNSYAGITVGFPIFQGGKRKYNIRAAEWQLRRTELDIENLKNTVSTEQASALANYKASLANYHAVKENVELAKEVYEVINLQYRAGVKTYLEVITAETDLRTAQINYFNALYQVLSSKTDVQKSRGDIRPE